MATFLHTADTHLGYRQYHRPEREQDYVRVFEQIITEAITNEVSAVVHAGDFFHDSRPTTTTIRAALEQLRRLEDHDIEFLGVVGNHDGTQSEQWIDIFNELGLAAHLDLTPHVSGDVAFYGIDHIPESRRTEFDYAFEPHSASHAVLVLHGLVAPLSPLGTWDLNHILGSSSVEFDAVLLGDDHTPRIDRVGETVVTYPGSPERTAVDQTTPRVCNLISTGGSPAGIQVDQVELDTRAHIFCEIELSPGEGGERLRRELENRDVTDAVVAIIVTGEGEDITPAAIEEFGKDQGAFVVRVSDRRHLDSEDIDLDVTFADPDTAVQERIRQLGLSAPTYDIEQRVRDLDVPISNLANQLEDEFDRRIDEDLAAFEKEATIEAPEEEEEPLSDFTEITTHRPAGDEQDAGESADATESEEAATTRSSQLSFDDLEP